MASLSLGSLKFIIGADDTDLKNKEKTSADAAKRIQNNFNKASQSIITTANKISIAFVAAMYKAGSAIGSTIDRVNELNNAATNLGVAVESISALEFAAANLGIEVANLHSGFSTLIKKMQEREAASEGVRVFQALNISVRDAAGQMKNADAVFGELANRFSQMKDGPEKSALAMKALGDSGAKLLPLLNQGAVGLDKFKKQAQETGAIVTSDTVESFNTARLVMAELSSIVSTILLKATADLAPAFKAISEVMADTTSETRVLDGVTKLLGGTFKVLVSAASAVGFAFSSLYTTISTVAKAVYEVATGKFSEAWETIKAGGRDVNAQFENTGKVVWETWMGTAEKLSKSAEEMPKKFAAPIVKSAEDVSRALESIRLQNQYLFEDLTSDKTLGASEKLIQLEELVRRGAISWREYHAAIKAIKEEQDGFAFQDLMDADTTPMEEKLARLREMVDRGALSWREYTQAVKSVTKSNEQSMDDLLSTTSSVLTQLFAKNKAAAIASAIINTYQGITKAIAAYPPPISYAMAGLQAALGFAQVRAITSTSNSTSTPSSTTGGGAAAAAASTQAPEGPRNTLFVQGFKADNFLSGDAVRSLAEKLLDYQRDGGRVVLAPM